MRSVGAITLALLTGSSLAAQTGSRDWRPEERVVLTDFSMVEAVAGDESLVYVVTSGGIGVYERAFRHWQPPVTKGAAYPAWRGRAALIDPIDRSLWIATDGGLVHFMPTLRTFESVAIPGGVRQLMFDERDAFRGLFILSGRSWEFLPRGGLVPVPAGALPPPLRQLRSPTLTELEEQYPFLVSMRGLALTDDRLRRYRFTAAAEVPAANELFLGTDGYGVFRVDLLSVSFERLPFGLLATGAAAVLPVSDGVWVGTDGSSVRAGLTFVSGDLQRFVYEEGPAVTGFGAVAVVDLVAGPEQRGVWAATDAGVVRLSRDGVRDRLTTSDGLPGDQVYALASGAGGVWVGTTRGLAFASGEGVVQRVGESVLRVNALAARGDTAWVGTHRGLGVIWAGSERIVVPDDALFEPLLAEEITALAWAGDTLVAVTRDRMAWRAPGTRWQIGALTSSHLGEFTALAPDSAGVWVGGDRGFALYRFRTRDFVLFNALGDLPGSVRDLAAAGRYLWVATGGGAVRFDRRSLLP